MTGMISKAAGALKRLYCQEREARKHRYVLVGTREKVGRKVAVVHVVGRAVTIEMPIAEAVERRDGFPPEQRYQLGVLHGLDGKYGPEGITQTELRPNAAMRGLPAVAIAFVTCLILSTVTASKLTHVGAVVFPAALVFFPFSFVFNDILTEVYGYHQSRKVIWSGVVANIAFIACCQIAVALPAADVWDRQQAFIDVFGVLPKFAAASISAYLIGEFCNSYLIAKLKILTTGRHFWLRLIVSSSFSIAIDSLVYTSIAFGISGPDVNLLGIAAAQYVAKLSYITMTMPLTYVISGFLKKLDNIDWYDYGTNFNPLAVFKASGR